MSLLIEFLNLTVIVLCFVIKFPQIITVIKSKSAIGLSSNSVLTELLGHSINLAYNVYQNYPVTSYFEIFFSVAQNIFLLFILYYYSGTLNLHKYVGMGLYLAVFYGLSRGIPNPHIIVALIKSVGVLVTVSKLLQLRTIVISQRSENVSATTMTIAIYICSIRIITIMALTGDLTLIINYSIALLLNTINLIFTMYYRQGNVKNKNE